MKRIYSILGAIVLVCFSFYYTDSAVNIVKRNDPIMKRIIEVSNDYDVKPINAILVDNNIIPGVSGTELDIDASYNKMKKLGEFNSGLLVFKEVTPTVSIQNSYDKYIVSGNENNNNISIVFKVNDTSYVEEIISILKNMKVKATFFLESSIIEQSPDVLKLLNNNDQKIEFLGNYDKKSLLNAEEIIKKNSKNKIKYCYSEYENNEVLDICSKNKMYTIIPSIITDKYPFSDIKTNVKNGSIIKLDNNSSTVRELKYIINFLLQKGYNIKALNELLDE